MLNVEILKETIYKILDDLKCENIEVLDVHKQTSLTTYIIIATGRSGKHIESVIEHVKLDLKANNIRLGKVEGKSTGWVILDLNNIIVHLFTQEERANFRLEEIWKK